MFCSGEWGNNQCTDCKQWRACSPAGSTQNLFLGGGLCTRLWGQRFLTAVTAVVRRPVAWHHGMLVPAGRLCHDSCSRWCLCAFPGKGSVISSCASEAACLASLWAVIQPVIHAGCRSKPGAVHCYFKTWAQWSLMDLVVHKSLFVQASTGSLCNTLFTFWPTYFLLAVTADELDVTV